MKHPLKAALFLPAVLLAGCNSSGGASESSKTAQFMSTAKFSYEGREITQENTVFCEFVGLNDGIVHIGRAPWIEGDRHWLKRSDGSIVIFPEFQSCMEGAELGERREVMAREEHLAPLSHETYVFDSSDKPTKVDILTADAFASAVGDSVLRSVSLTRADNPLTHRLATAFPGLGKIVPEPDPILTEGLGADMYPGMFVGVQAKASILAPNTKCGTSATTGVVILPERDGCQFVNDCKKSGPKIVCGKDAGGLRVTYDKSLSTATVAMGEPDAKYQMTLYDSRLPAFGNAPSIPWNNHRKWTPRLCVAELCATPTKPFLPVLFYFPAKRLLIEVGPVHRPFGKGMFSARRML